MKVYISIRKPCLNHKLYFRLLVMLNRIVSKVLNKKEYMITHIRSSLFIYKFTLKMLFKYLINVKGVTQQSRFLRNRNS